MALSGQGTVSTNLLENEGFHPISIDNAHRHTGKMKTCVIVLGLAYTVAIADGQSKFSWQDYCFNNPASPVCKGNQYAVKPQPKAAEPRGVVTNPFASIQSGGNASVFSVTAPGAGPMDVVSGAMKWQFADPSTDLIAGINVRGLAGSHIARGLIVFLAANRGLAQTDVEKLFEKLSEVDQITVSIRDNQVVAFVIGQVPDSVIQAGVKPLTAPGLKVVTVSRNAMLFGHTDAVDQAAARIASASPPSELTRLAAMHRDSGAEFWAIGSAPLVLPDAAKHGATRSSLVVWIRDDIGLVADLAFTLNRAPGAAALREAQSSLGAVQVDGNAVRSRVSLDPAALSARFSVLAANPVGQQLSALIEAARLVPGRDLNAPKRRPVIVGLE